MKRFVALTLAVLFAFGGVAFAQGVRIERKVEKKKGEEPVVVEEEVIELESEEFIELDGQILIEKSACLKCKDGKGQCEKCKAKTAKHHGGAIMIGGDWESMPPETKKKILEEMRKHLTEEQMKQALEQLVRKKGGGSMLFETPKVSEKREVVIVKEGDVDGRFHIERIHPGHGRVHVVKKPGTCPGCGCHARRSMPRRRAMGGRAMGGRAMGHADGIAQALQALRAEIAALRAEIRGAHAAKKAVTSFRMVAPPKAVALPQPKAGKTKAMGGFSFGVPAGGRVAVGKAVPAKPNPEIAILRQQIADLKAENKKLKMMLHEIMKRLDDMKAEQSPNKAAK